MCVCVCVGVCLWVDLCVGVFVCLCLFECVCASVCDMSLCVCVVFFSLFYFGESVLSKNFLLNSPIVIIWKSATAGPRERNEN